MEQYTKSLNSVINMKTINSEIDTVDDALIKKLTKNEKYTEYLNNLLDECTNNLYKIVLNLDNQKR